MKNPPIYFLLYIMVLFFTCNRTNSIKYQLDSKDLTEVEKDLDHAGFIASFDGQAFVRGKEFTMIIVLIVMVMKKMKDQYLCL